MSDDSNAFGDLDATTLAELVRQGEVSAAEFVDDAIRRCEQVNGTLNAVIAVIADMFERARTAARQPARRRAFCRRAFSDKDFGAEVAGVRFS